MKEQGRRLITAEYSMLPYSTLQRKQRDISKGKIDGRSQEIQRLIGRAMRSAVDLRKLGQRTIGWIAMFCRRTGDAHGGHHGSLRRVSLAVKKCWLTGKVAGKSAVASRGGGQRGNVNEQALLDLCYTRIDAARRGSEPGDECRGRIHRVARHG